MLMDRCLKANNDSLGSKSINANKRYRRCNHYKLIHYELAHAGLSC